MAEPEISASKRKHPEPSGKHRRTTVNGNVPGFLQKVYDMLSDPDNNKIISWSEDGSSLLIKKQTEFADKILPKYFKHANFTSFVRQLNMYDFHKQKQEDNTICFCHPLFRRGSKHLLTDIKRKVPGGMSPRPQDASPVPIAEPEPEPAPEPEPDFEAKAETGSGGATCIEKLEQRLNKLENRDRQRDWLKNECSKLRYLLAS